MIWPDGSNKFCCLPFPCKGTSSRARKDCSLFHCCKQSNHKPAGHKSDLGQAGQPTGSIGLHSSAGCAGKSGLYPDVWSLPWCSQVVVGVKGQVFTLCHSSLFCLSSAVRTLVVTLGPPSWSRIISSVKTSFPLLCKVTVSQILWAWISLWGHCFANHCEKWMFCCLKQSLAVVRNYISYQPVVSLYGRSQRNRVIFTCSKEVYSKNSIGYQKQGYCCTLSRLFFPVCLVNVVPDLMWVGSIYSMEHIRRSDSVHSRRDGAVVYDDA